METLAIGIIMVLAAIGTVIGIKEVFNMIGDKEELATIHDDMTFILRRNEDLQSCVHDYEVIVNEQKGIITILKERIDLLDKKILALNDDKYLLEKQVNITQIGKETADEVIQQLQLDAEMRDNLGS